MNQRDEATARPRAGTMQRREFLGVTRNLAVGGMLAQMFLVEEAGAMHLAIPASAGYLLVDTKKCQGCVSCMLACSLVHEGIASLSLARIQVLQNSFERWPADVQIAQCRQCVEPECVLACAEQALTADPDRGFVRVIDLAKCTGCGECIEACPHSPSRALSVPDAAKLAGFHAAKCDLCAGAKHHWSSKGGGPDGEQACVEICPVHAIKFTRVVPEQTGAGYDVNLRDESWGRLGYPTD